MAERETAKEVRKTARSILNEFTLCIREIEVTRTELSRLDSLLRTREVSEKVADSLIQEQNKKLLKMTEDFFSLQDRLEDARARVMLELEKVRVSFERGWRTGSEMYSEMYSAGVREDISRMERLLDEINSASNLNIDTKVFIAKNYISAGIEADTSMTGEEKKGERKKWREVCSKFLDGIFKEWVSRKDEILQQTSDLDSSIIDLRNAAKENWVRYAVGEYDQKTFEARRDELEGKISAIEIQSLKLKGYIEEVDSKISECLRTLKEKA